MGIIKSKYFKDRPNSSSDIQLNTFNMSQEEPIVKPVQKSKETESRNNPPVSCFKLRIFLNSFCNCFQRGPYAGMTKAERTIKATLLIQKWYRRYLARIEAKRIYSWTIFQTLEYAGEQDQVKLYNFFNALLTHIAETSGDTTSITSQTTSTEKLDFSFDEESPDPDEELMSPEDRRLCQRRLKFPLTQSDAENILDIFRRNRHYRLPPSTVAEILRRAIKLLKKQPNFNTVSTAYSNRITICGDLHGKYDDLLMVFSKNGYPSSENPYIFNGDFVDRGKRGMEIFIILLCYFLVFPDGVFLNRGNHEDPIMNQRYGFLREVQTKYRRNSEKILKLIECVFKYLPLGTIINNKVLVVHGGISDTTDLTILKNLERQKYVSLLRPPMTESGTTNGPDTIDKIEWKQVFDILWSDPQPENGCIPNQLRGAGTYFGPDVTRKFLNSNNLEYLVRSHECKREGYELAHNDKLITVFSASNYYEAGSNNGAYLIIGPDLEKQFVQYMTTTGRHLTFFQRIGAVELSAIKELQLQIINNKERLLESFQTADSDNTGLISVYKWCKCLVEVTGLDIPWMMLKEKLVEIDPETQKARYMTTFDARNLNVDSVQGGSTVVETLYRNKKSLEAIFHLLDKDNSGYISLDEFTDACNLIKEHLQNPLTQDQLEELCRMMDLNKDGKVDLNEFLESFRLVDPETRRLNQPQDPPQPPPDNNDLQQEENLQPSNAVHTPPVSPSVVKAFVKMPLIEEEKQNNNDTANGKTRSTTPCDGQNGCTKKLKNNGHPKKGKNKLIKSSVKVVVHDPEEVEKDINQPGTSGNQGTPLTLSPVLSSRRGH